MINKSKSLFANVSKINLCQIYPTACVIKCYPSIHLPTCERTETSVSCWLLPNKTRFEPINRHIAWLTERHILKRSPGDKECTS